MVVSGLIPFGKIISQVCRIFPKASVRKEERPEVFNYRAEEVAATSGVFGLAVGCAFSPAFSIAKEAAIGAVAYAEQVNNERAASIPILSRVDQSYVMILGIMAVLVLVPVVWYAKTVRKRMRAKQ